MAQTARLGRQVDHFKEVDIDTISAEFSDDKVFRYTLSMKYSGNLLSERGGEEITVILKNPSSADEKRADSTIRKVETYVWQNFPKAGKLNILNIFSFRATDAIELNQRMKAEGYESGVGKDNDRWFIKLLGSSDAIICAWGGPSGIDPNHYQLRIGEVKKLLRNRYSRKTFHIVGKQATKEPLHGLMWGYDYAIKEFSL